MEAQALHHAQVGPNTARCSSRLCWQMLPDPRSSWILAWNQARHGVNVASLIWQFPKVALSSHCRSVGAVLASSSFLKLPIGMLQMPATSLQVALALHLGPGRFDVIIIPRGFLPVARLGDPSHPSHTSRHFSGPAPLRG